MNASPPAITALEEALTIFADETVMGLDLETSGVHFMKDQIAVVSLFGEKSKQTAILHVQGYLPPPLINFLSSRRMFIGHNIAAFDLLFLFTAGVNIHMPVYYDTMIAEALTIASARKDLRVSLKAAIKRRLGIDLLKDQGLSTWMAKSLTAEQIRYCREDVQYLPKLRKAQMKAMGSEQLRALDFEHQLLPTIVAMTLRGLPVDYDKLQEYEANNQQQVTRATDYLTEQLGPFNLFSPTGITKLVRENTGHQLASATLESYKAMSEEPGEVGTIGHALMTLKAATGADNAVNTFWADEHVFCGRIYPRYRHIDRDYGRLGITEPNLELLPTTARSLIGGEPGYSIYSVSFKDLWWLVMASLAKDVAMIQVTGDNLIRNVSQKMFADTELDHQRQVAALVRSQLFGHPLYKLSRQLRVMGVEMEPEAVRALQALFYKNFPGLGKLHAQSRMQAMLPAVPVTFPTGMRRTLPKGEPHVIVSLRAKGMVGALVKKSILALTQAGLSEYLIGVVGEELLLSISDDQPNRIEEVKTCLANEGQSTLGFPVEPVVRSGNHWS